MSDAPRRVSNVRRTPLGNRLRDLRGNLTLRELAGELDVDFTYLSKIENGLDVPGEETLRKVAARFGPAPEALLEELMGLAGKVSPALKARAQTEQKMGRLLRRLPNLSTEQLERIYGVAGLDDDETIPR